MTGRSLLAALWRRRFLALLILLVELGAVAYWLTVSPRKYTATATMTVTPSSSLLSSSGNFDNLETTVGQIANSGSVLSDVSARLNGVRTVHTLRSEVTGNRVAGTVLVRITVVDVNPRIAAKVANSVAAVLPLHDPSGGMFLFTQSDSATVPATYSSPNTKVIGLAGAVLGLFLAAAAALLRDRTARTVESAEQLRASSGIEVLGDIPKLGSLSTVIDSERLDPVTMALRSLRVELDYASSDAPTGAIVIANAAGSGGQSAWLVVNLATSLARVDHRVLIIDGNFRGRRRHSALTEETSPGLYGVLRDECTFADAVRRGPQSGVDVLPAGMVPSTGDRPAPGTASLIELRFRAVVESAQGSYDAVLVLAPSPSESDDARVMAIGGSLLLAVATRSIREAKLRQLVTHLRSTRTRVLGAVFIRSRRHRRG